MSYPATCWQCAVREFAVLMWCTSVPYLGMMLLFSFLMPLWLAWVLSSLLTGGVIVPWLLDRWEKTER